MARAPRITVEIGPAEAVADLLSGLHDVIDGEARDGQTVRDAVTRLLEAFAATKPFISTAPDEPRTWSLPPEPGPEVTAVRCGCHGRWKRVTWPHWTSWELETPIHPGMGPYVVLWRGFGLCMETGLTDATGEQS